MRKLILTILILFITTPSFAAYKYVRKGATGSNNGTDWTNAWTDFGSISGLSAGDTVYVAAGSYTGSYTFTASGTNGNPITIKRATVALHGSATGWSDSYDGLVLVSASSGSGATFHTNGQSYITIDGNDRTKFVLNGNKNKEYGVVLAIDGGHNNRLLNVTVHDYYHLGIWVRDNAGGIELAYCEVYHNGDDNRIPDTSFNVSFYTNSNAYGWNNIHHNKVYDGGNYAVTQGLEDNFVLWGNDLYINIYNNEVFINASWGCSNSSRDMIWVSGNHVNVYNNLIYATGSGCTVQQIFVPAYGTNAHIKIYNNVLYKPPSGAGFGVFLTSGVGGGYWNDVMILNNTIYGHGFPIYISEIAGHITNVTVKNNILRTGGTSGEITLHETSLQADVTSDYNYFDSSSGGPIITIAGTNYYISSPPSGWDSHSAEGNPQYDSIGITGFHPTESSPTKDIGTDMSSLFSTDKAGVTRPKGPAWDIGPYEGTYQNLTSNLIPNSPTSLEIR